MSDDWTESDNNCFEDLVAEIKIMKRIKPYQLILMLRSLIHGADQLDDKTRGLFISLRVYYYDKMREREKDRNRSRFNVKEPPEKMCKPNFDVENEPLITSIDFKKNKNQGITDDIKIQTNSLERFNLAKVNSINESKTTDLKSEMKLKSKPNNKREEKAGQGKVKNDKKSVQVVEKRRNVHFSIKVNKDSVDIEPEDLIFEHNIQRQQLIKAQELLVVNSKLDEAIADVLETVIDRMCVGEDRDVILSVVSLLKNRRSMSKEDINKIKMSLADNLNKIIENTKMYLENTYIYSETLAMTIDGSKLKTC